ncbi:exopolysaccharide biosynthesis polyprenyl glycosylphosphotransferase [Dongia sedimenti]|uniref:Exopolysaccharide biosynthesis polyprenyl glycosylphosphotransferase n=1 Tax=Dongia sedimenti TaxID=3064282 RepID=A0ABU0YM22_9PROT|nr:exopolysaccharide biosynthesis polyprenyl glycosylphosphotransferase [Rhodospirillaceae bacterium R-7]
MEGSFLQAVRKRAVGDAVPNPSSRLYIDPPTLGLLFLTLDVTLFLVPGFVIANSAGLLAAGGMTTLQSGLALCLAIAFFLAAARAFDIHEGLKIMRRAMPAQIALSVVCVAGPVLALLLICRILTGDAPAGRPVMAWLLAWAAWSGGGALALQILARPAVRHWRAASLTGHRVAIVGSGEPAQRLVNWLEANARDVVQVVGLFDDRRGRGPDRVGLSHLICGTTGDLIEYYRHAPLDKIIIALPHHAEERLLAILQRLKQLPVDIALAPDLVGFRVPDSATAEMAGLQMRSLAQRPLRASQRFIKDLFDRAIAALLLLMLAPLLLVLALGVRLSSPGPVFFRQERHGLGNRVFEVLKFRTMRAEMHDPGGRRQTARNDPRVTAFGAILRRTSLDELPQLINVLKGDMSLVGPRPLPLQMRVDDRLNYEIVAEYAFRHRMKPGITGLAQVKGHRGAVSTAEALRSRVACDLYYIDNWSLWLDLKILALTSAVCVLGKNAF